MKAIVCPNCGANATNHENCEFCGSLLVRFEDLNIQYDEDNYNDPDIVESPLGDILSLHLMTTKQPGIGGVCTRISDCGEPGTMALGEHTVCFVMNGAYLTQFGLSLITPSPTDKVKSYWSSYKDDPYFIMQRSLDYYEGTEKGDEISGIKFYDLSSKSYFRSTFILVIPFIDFSDVPSINSSRWEPSMNLIRINQLKKRPLMRKDFAKLLHSEIHKFEDYNIELFIMDFGEDIQGATSIISQLSEDVLDCAESYMGTKPVETPTVKSSFFKKLF